VRVASPAAGWPVTPCVQLRAGRHPSLCSGEGRAAAVLGYEHGVGVRSGCFCAQPYVHHLLGLSARDVARWVADVARGDVRKAPGLVRISVGGHSDRGDIDRALNGLRHIVAGEIKGTYQQRPDGSSVRFARTANTPTAGGRAGIERRPTRTRRKPVAEGRSRPHRIGRCISECPWLEPVALTLPVGEG
jgi:hypothetical protein